MVVMSTLKLDQYHSPFFSKISFSQSLSIFLLPLPTKITKIRPSLAQQNQNNNKNHTLENVGKKFRFHLRRIIDGSAIRPSKLELLKLFQQLSNKNEFFMYICTNLRTCHIAPGFYSSNIDCRY